MFRISAFIFFVLLFGSTGAQATSLLVPEGYVKVRSKRCSFVLPSKNLSVANNLSKICDEAFVRINNQLNLGQSTTGASLGIEVRIVAEPSDMAGVAPPGNPPPDWSSAVAYPDDGLIILPLHHADGRPVQDIDVVLEHEISHIVMREILNGVHIPRWFSEGVAVMQSEGSSFARRSVLPWALMGDTLLEIESLENYPLETGKIGLVYAEAADFVGFLLRDKGWHGVKVILHRLRLGDTFEDAFQVSYNRKISAAESEWKESLKSTFNWLALLTGSSALWGFITLLSIWVYFSVKKRQKIRLEQMELEEEPVDRLIASIEKLEQKAPDPRLLSGKLTGSESNADSDVKAKIEADGETHTLH